MITIHLLWCTISNKLCIYLNDKSCFLNIFFSLFPGWVLINNLLMHEFPTVHRTPCKPSSQAIELLNKIRTKERDLKWTKPTTLLIVHAIRSHPLPSLFLSPKLLVNLQPILFILFPSL